MPIKLDDLSGIATIIKTKYGNSLYKMNFIFCFKKDFNSYFIFQEIQGMPIKRVVYHESNTSVTFVASWAAWNNPYAIIADANYDAIENWKDLQDRSRPYNSYIEGGGFNTYQWKTVNRKNTTEKKKRHKHKSDVFAEFRVDKIHRANFNEWGFELYSDTISMIGFSSRYNFPYTINEVESQGMVGDPVGLGFGPNYTPPEDEDGIFVNKVTWQGGSFKIPEFNSEEEISQISNPIGMPGSNCNLSSYWSADESDDMFDEEIASILLDNRKKDDTILDVGQKKVDLFFGD